MHRFGAVAPLLAWRSVPSASRALRVALAGASAAVLGASTVVALVRFPAEVSSVFASAPREVVPRSIRAGIAVLRRHARSGEAILYVTDVPEAWYSRVWHRALYPAPVLLATGSELGGPRIAVLRKSFAVRWAISSGRPARDPGFLWSIPLPDDPEGREVLFGELRP
jgi:hypothetical protein